MSSPFVIILLLHFFHTSQIILPIHDEFLGMGLKNVTCAVDTREWSLSMQRERPLYSHMVNATVECSGDLKFFSYYGKLHFAVDVGESESVINERLPVGSHLRTSDGTAHGLFSAAEQEYLREAVLDACALNVAIRDVSVAPPDPLLDRLSTMAKSWVNNNVEHSVCENLVPLFRFLMRRSAALIPLAPPVDVVDNATIPLAKSELFSSAAHLLHALPPPVPGAKMTASFIGETSLRLSCVLEQGLSLTYKSGDEKNWKIVQILISAALKHLPEIAARFAKVQSLSPHKLALLKRDAMSPLFDHRLPWSEDTGLDFMVHSVLPPGTAISLDLNVKGFRWNGKTYECSFYRDGGVSMSNLRIENAGEFGGIMTNFVLPFVTHRINKVIDSTLQLLPLQEGSDSLVSLPEWKPHMRFVPPTLVFIVYACVALAICVCVIENGRRRHRQTPIQSSVDLTEISLLRVMSEDLILSVGVCLCFGCFVWSNCTTAATVLLGEKLMVYNFSLRSTVTDLWAAGLNPLSFAVALFSGIYPYVKLMGVLYYTAVKQSPDAPMLHAMDYVGKLSLLDTFVMLMMVTGLTINEVADVVVYAPFYIFLAGTLGSIAMGNYATRIWRRNTTMRVPRDHNNWWILEDDAAAGSEEEEEGEEDIIREEDVGVQQEENTGDPAVFSAFVSRFIRKCCHVFTIVRQRWRYVWRGQRRFRQALKRSGGMLIASLPAWFFPLVSYRVGGVGPLLTKQYKTYSLTALSAAVDPVCLGVTLFTVLVAPCLYVAAPRKLRWLASWCAADALVLACLAGLIQLNDFVEFIVGEELVGIYTAHAILHLALLPLFLAAVYVWWLVFSDLLYLKGPADAWHRFQLFMRNRRRSNVEETQPFLDPSGGENNDNDRISVEEDGTAIQEQPTIV